MWSELSVPWQAAFEEAWAAYRSGCVPIGAVVTDADGKILSRGHNHINIHDSIPGVVTHTQLAHAELNALIALPPSDFFDPHPCHLYTTMEPCPLCMGALYMSGVRNLHFCCRDPYAGSIDLLGTTEYMRRKNISVFGPEENAVLEEISMAMQVEYLLRTREAFASSIVMLRYKEVLPHAFEFGRYLSEEGQLGVFVEEKTTIGQVINWCEEQLAR